MNIFPQLWGQSWDELVRSQGREVTPEAPEGLEDGFVQGCPLCSHRVQLCHSCDSSAGRGPPAAPGTALWGGILPLIWGHFKQVQRKCPV